MTIKEALAKKNMSIYRLAKALDLSMEELLAPCFYSCRAEKKKIRRKTERIEVLFRIIIVMKQSVT